MSRLSQSFLNALRGLLDAFKSEPNLRVHAGATLAVFIAGLLAGLSGIEFAIIFLCMGFVFAMELFNTAIERLADVAHPERNPKVRLLKDVSAAATLIAALTAACAGLAVFLPHL